MAGTAARRYTQPVWRAAFGLGIGLLILVLTAKGADPKQVWAALETIRLPYVLLAWLTVVLTQLAKAVRWRRLLYPHQTQVGNWALAGLIVIGQAVNFFIPGRWGELVRAYLGGNETGIAKSFVLGTIAAEKLLEVVMLAVLAVAVVPLVAMSGRNVPGIRPALVMALALTIAVTIFLAGRRVWLRLAQRAMARLPEATAQRWQRRLNALLDGLAVLSTAQAAPAIWGWTVVCWALAGLTNWFLLLAFSLPASLLMAVFLLVVLQGGVAVPSTPGKIGVFQYLCVVALGVFGVPSAVAFGYGLVLYALVVGTMGVWAALALWQRSWNLQRLREASSGLVRAGE